MAADSSLQKPPVAADQIDLVGPGRRLRIGRFHAAAQQDQGDGRGGAAREAGLGRQLVGQLGAKEAIGDEDLVDASQPVQGQPAEAAAHRVAHQQGPGKYGRSRRDAAGHGQVHPPMVQEGGEDKADDHASHGARRRRAEGEQG